MVGVPDHVFSERLKAVVVLKPGQSATAEEIRGHCAQHLAKYETPEYVVFASTLPTNPAGKTLKTALVDFWGEAEGAAPARFAAFCASMPSALMEMPHLRIDGKPATPREVLSELERSTERGQRIARTIAEQGLSALTRPSEARFQK